MASRNNSYPDPMASLIRWAGSFSGVCLAFAAAVNLPATDNSLRLASDMLQLLHAQSAPTPTAYGLRAVASTSSHIIILDHKSQFHILSSRGESLHIIKAYAQGEVLALATAVDGLFKGGEEIILAGDMAGGICAYSILSGDPRLPFPKAHSCSIAAFALVNVPTGSSSSMTCSRLLSSDACGLILVWDLKNRSVIHKLQGHCKAVPFLFMLRGQNTLASGSHDGTTRLWDMETGFEKAVLDVKVHAGGRAEQTLRSESASRDNCELSLKDNKHTRTVDFRTNIYGFLVLNDGRIIGGGRSGFVHVWDSTSRYLIANWQAHFKGNPSTGPVLNNILLHPSRAAFVTTGTDGRICLWDLRTYCLLRSVQPFDRSVTSVTFINSTIVCGGKDGGGQENVCGLFCRAIEWDLSQLRLKDGESEGFTQLGMPSGLIRKVWNSGRNVVISKAIGDQTRVEIWGENDERLREKYPN